MNKNLKKLLEQATIYAFDSRFVHGDNPRPVADAIQEKFAELIVRECARVYWNIDNGETHTEYVEALKQHFGVEE